MGIGRFFALETDMGNEPGHVNDPEMYHRRKSYERMYEQYHELIAMPQRDDGKLYNKAYHIPRDKPLMVLFVTTAPSKLALMEKVITELSGGKGCNWFLMKHIPAESFSAYHSPKPLSTLWTEPWKRAGRPDFYINNPGRQ